MLGLGIPVEVDGREFFLARGGKTDPAAELEATLRGLLAPGRAPVRRGTPDAAGCPMVRRGPGRVRGRAARVGRRAGGDAGSSASQASTRVTLCSR